MMRRVAKTMTKHENTRCNTSEQNQTAEAMTVGLVRHLC